MLTAYNIIQGSDNEAAINARLLYDYSEYSRVWRQEANENYYLYHNETFTDEQKNKLAKLGLPEFTTNDFHKNLKLLYSMLISNQVKLRLRKRFDYGNNLCELQEKLVNITLNEARSQQAKLVAFKELILTGMGVMEVIPTYNSFDQFGVHIDSIPSSAVMADPMTQRMTWEDAPAIIVTRLLTRQQINEHGEYKDLIEGYSSLADYFSSFESVWQVDGITRSFRDIEALPYYSYYSAFSPTQTSDINNPRSPFMIIERYEKVKQDIYLVDTSVLPNGVPIFRRFLRDTVEERRLKAAMSKAGVKFIKKSAYLVRKVVSIGKNSKVIDLPLTHYPIVPIVEEYRGNPFPISIASYIKPVQRRLTYTQIQHLAIMKNLRTGQKYVDRNAVDKADEGGIDELVAQSQKQNSILSFNVPKDKKVSDVVQDASLPPYPKELPLYEMSLKSAMLDAVSLKGVNDVEEQSSADDLSAMMRKRTLISRGLTPAVEHIKVSYRQLILSIIENWTNLAPPDVSLFVENTETKEMEEININTIQAVPTGYQVKNPIALADSDPLVEIIIDPISDAAMKIDRLSFLAQAGAAEVPELLMALVDVMELHNGKRMKESILERFDLKPQLKQAEEMIARLQKENETLNMIAKEEKLNRQLEIRKQRANTQIINERESAKKELTQMIDMAASDLEYEKKIFELELAIQALKKELQNKDASQRTKA